MKTKNCPPGIRAVCGSCDACRCALCADGREMKKKMMMRKRKMKEEDRSLGQTLCESFVPLAQHFLKRIPRRQKAEEHQGDPDLHGLWNDHVIPFPYFPSLVSSLSLTSIPSWTSCASCPFYPSWISCACP